MLLDQIQASQATCTVHTSPRVMGLPARGRPGLGSVSCNPDKTMLLISSSHEKQTAIKPRAASLETESFMSMNRNEESSLPGITPVPSMARDARRLGVQWSKLSNKFALFHWGFTIRLLQCYLPSGQLEFPTLAFRRKSDYSYRYLPGTQITFI